MNRPPPSDPDDFQQELEMLRSVLQAKLQQAKQDPLLGPHLEFWLESAKFLELNIEIWDRAGDVYQESQARERMHNVLDILQELVERMDKMNGNLGDGKI